MYTLNNSQQCSNLLISKARVAPCQEDRLTIPKLELTTSLIGARLIRYLSNLFTFSAIRSIEKVLHLPKNRLPDFDECSRFEGH